MNPQYSPAQGKITFQRSQKHVCPRTVYLEDIDAHHTLNMFPIYNAKQPQREGENKQINDLSSYL